MREEVFWLGRLLFSLVLIDNGIRHLVINTEGSTQYAAYKKIPNAKLMVQITGVCMLLGAAAVILGIVMDLAAFLIAVLMVIFAFTMHKFWEETDPQTQAVERAQFMKNISIAGGGLILAAVTNDFTPYTLTDAVF
jgi:putative oxidoreductase